MIQAADRYPTRAAIGRALCEMLAWRQPNGGLKAMSARVALLRMERDGLITLPPPTHGHANGHRRPKITPASDPGEPVQGTRRELGSLHLERVQDPVSSRLWNELIERYHYLGYQPLPGAQARYFVVTETPRLLLGAIGLSAAAWRLAPRDRFIGWTDDQRQQRLDLVVNQSRYLILPWVCVRNLASSVLGLMARVLVQDWQELYGYRPVLLETFVDGRRFRGTCYRAANWIHLGQTQGRGKLDRHGRRPLPVKEIFVYPLRRDFRAVLRGDLRRVERP